MEKIALVEAFSLSDDKAKEVAQKMLGIMKFDAQRYADSARASRGELADAMNGKIVASFFRHYLERIENQEVKSEVLGIIIESADEQLSISGHGALAAIILSPHTIALKNLSAITDDRMNTVFAYITEYIEEVFYKCYSV